MKIITVAGGKGGVGKTLIATGIAISLSKKYKVLLVDSDVDNPCVESTLGIECRVTQEITMFKPIFNVDKCDFCGKCVENCPEHAITIIPNLRKIIWLETLCSGCGICKLICPIENAILNDERKLAYVKEGVLNNLHIVVCELIPGVRPGYTTIVKFMNSIRNRFEDYDYVIIDSPPGTGSGVFALTRIANIIVAVTEPTKLGINDYEKFMKLIQKSCKNFEKIITVVNKFNLSTNLTNEIEKLCNKYGSILIKIPYIEDIPKKILENSEFQLRISDIVQLIFKS